MHDSGDKSQKRQDNIDPEMFAEPHLKKYADGRADDGGDDSD